MKETSFCEEEEEEEKEDEGEENGEEGDEESGEGPGDPIRQTASCEDFHLHKTALAWLWHLDASALPAARNLKRPHQDWKSS